MVKKLSTPERVSLMLAELSVDQPSFAKLAGTSKSMVNHWLTGAVKSITATYAFKLQRTTGYNAEWIQTGEGVIRQTDAQIILNETQGTDQSSVFGNSLETDFLNLTDDGKDLVLTQIKIALETAKKMYGTRTRQSAA